MGADHTRFECPNEKRVFCSYCREIGVRTEDCHCNKVRSRTSEGSFAKPPEPQGTSVRCMICVGIEGQAYIAELCKTSRFSRINPEKSHLKPRDENAPIRVPVRIGEEEHSMSF